MSSFVLEVPLCNLRPSVIYSVPCDRIVQRAYCFERDYPLASEKVYTAMPTGIMGNGSSILLD